MSVVCQSELVDCQSELVEDTLRQAQCDDKELNPTQSHLQGTLSKTLSNSSESPPSQQAGSASDTEEKNKLNDI